MSATTGKKTRLTDHELANLAREGHTPDEIAAAHGIGPAHVRTRLRDLGLAYDGSPVVVAPKPRERVVNWNAGRDEEWRDDAECFRGGHNPELWFVSPDQQPKLAAVAKVICGSCDVRAKCLDVALRAEEGLSRQYRSGIVGGMTVSERMALGSEAVA